MSGNKISQSTHQLWHPHGRKQLLKVVTKVWQKGSIVALLVLLNCLVAQPPAMAHHAMAGKTPTNFFEGFISGLAHPVIGLDHFAFVVAMGLLSAGRIRGALLPAGFILAALAGTGIHLLSIDLPSAELMIAGSVIVFGVLLAMSRQLNWGVLAALATVAGLFHGYAYGEAIIGAGMTPLIAYLLGFSLIQYGVALVAFLVGNAVSKKSTQQTLSWRRLAGLAISSIGVVFLTSSLIG